MQIELGTLTFNDLVPDGDGILWLITNMIGWEAPDIRQSLHPITSRDGVALGESQYGQRTIVLTGFVKAPTEALFWQAYNQLAGETQLRLETELVVYEGAIHKKLNVIKTAAPKIEFLGVSSFGFQLTVAALYPVKVDADTEKSAAWTGTMAIVNSGTYEVWPKIVMTSSGTPLFGNASAGASGLAIAFTGSLSSGTIIDFKERTVLSSGGTDLYSLLDTANDDWWPVMSGSNTLIRSGTGSATIYWRDAWI